jgi:hypothetical protein
VKDAAQKVAVEYMKAKVRSHAAREH